MFIALQARHGNIRHAGEMPLRSPKVLPVPEVVQRVVFIPGPGQRAPGQELVSGPVLPAGKGGDGGVGRMRSEARGHPAVVGVAQNQALLRAHLSGFD